MSSTIKPISTLLSRTAGLIAHVDVKLLNHGTSTSSLPTSATFVGESIDLGWGRVYGGQTMAQGLSACQRLANSNFDDSSDDSTDPKRVKRRIHQFCTHFIRPGDVKEPVKFEADLLGHGRSFSTVHVRGIQKNKVILAMTANLQVPEDGLEHLFTHRGERDKLVNDVSKPHLGLRPEWKTPDECTDLFIHLQPHLSKIPDHLRALYEVEQPLEIRPTEFIPAWDKRQRPPCRTIWIKSRSPLDANGGDKEDMNARLLAYISDWSLLECAIFPHNIAMSSPGLQIASLSHTLNYHKPFDLENEWLCHAMYSPCSVGGRGFCLGEFWNMKGELVASSSQEGLIRYVKREEKKKNVLEEEEKDGSLPSQQY